MLLSAYKSVWPSNGLAQLDPNYNSLVGWWDFEEGSGTAANDFSASTPGNNAQLCDGASCPAIGPTWTNSGCVSGECLSFDGDSNYVSANTSASLNIGTSDLTISFWTNRRANSGWWDRFVAKPNAYGVAAFNNQMRLSLGSTDYYSSITTFDTNQWYHLVISVDRDGMATYYKNSTVLSTSNVSSQSSDNLTSGNNLNIGSYDSALYFVNGYIDDVRVYNTALTASQICHLCREKRSANFCGNCSE
jgi:hypothetical protein